MTDVTIRRNRISIERIPVTLLHSVKMLARRVGIEMHRYNPVESPSARLIHMLNQHHIDAVLDVGANDGGYGRFLRDGGYKGVILSFEPLAAAHQALVSNAKKCRNWHVAPRMALGEANGEIVINVAGNSTSSSVLPMLDLHECAAPDSKYIDRQRVPMRRLDKIGHDIITKSKNLLLKIDTQGYEMQVLTGAEDLLNTKIRGIQLELSTAPLYEGQHTYKDVIEYLSAHRYVMWDVIPGFVDPVSGRMLQFDGVFFKDGSD